MDIWQVARFSAPFFTEIPRLAVRIDNILQDEKIEPHAVPSAVTACVVDFLDDSFDMLPGWDDMTEADRDAVLAGVGVLGHYIAEGIMRSRSRIRKAGKPRGLRRRVD